jgi:hypothetical protein
VLVPPYNRHRLGGCNVVARFPIHVGKVGTEIFGKNFLSPGESVSGLFTLLSECIRGKTPSDYVLTRSDGTQVKDFRATWRNLCVQVGLGEWRCRTCGNVVKGRECCGSDDLKYFGLIGHDFRRSAARGYRRAGVPESVVMKIGGWKTRSMFDRYNITDSKDVAEGIVKREAARSSPDEFISPEISPDHGWTKDQQGRMILLIILYLDGARDRNRTDTSLSRPGILSPL